jgi:flagellar protein FlaG
MKIDAVNSPRTMQPVENKANDATINKIDDATISKTKDTDKIDSSKVIKAVDTLNTKAEEIKYDVRFAVNKEPHRIIIEVVDKSNNQVISTIPSKQILEMAAMVDEDFKLLDKKI